MVLPLPLLTLLLPLLTTAAPTRIFTSPDAGGGNVSSRRSNNKAARPNPPAWNSGSLKEEKRASTTRYVFCHIVQGDFQNYQAADWTADVALAKAAGIDAFALNVGGDSTDAAQMKLAFAAAAADGTFKMFYSFDMTTKFNGAGESSIILSQYLTPYATGKGYFNYNSQPLVTTFSGEVSDTYLNAAGSMDASVAAWQSLIASAKAQSPSINIFFVPDWNDPAADTPYAAQFGDGIMGWNAWPTDGTDMTTSSDLAYQSAIASSKASMVYIATVSAFFFVHVADTNNRIFRSDDWLLPTHYKQLIEMTKPPDFIEILTWNDYGESHYLGPVRANAGVPTGALGYATAAFDHTPMLTLSSYYTSWYKTGTAPVIKSNTVVWWYRPHPKAATATKDSVAQPSDTAWTDDNLYACVLIPAGSSAKSLIFTTGGKAGTAQSVSVGVNLLKTPFSSGAQAISLVDASGTVLLGGSGADIQGLSVPTYNFNYYSYILPNGSTPASIISGSAEIASTGATVAGSGSSNSNSTLAASSSAAGVNSAKGDSSTPTSVTGASAPATGAAGTAGAAGTTEATGTTVESADTSLAGGSTGASTLVEAVGASTEAAAARAGSGAGTTGSGTETSAAADGASTSPASSTSTSTSVLSQLDNAGWFGLQEWIWVALILLIPILAILAWVLMKQHGSVAKKRGKAAVDSSSSDSSCSDSDDAAKKKSKSKHKHKKSKASSSSSSSAASGSSSDSDGGSSSDGSTKALKKKKKKKKKT